MQSLVLFLHEVHAMSEVNLMNASNLAKVFIPNLSQENCVTTDPVGIAETQIKLAALFAFTIENAKEAFYVPKAVAGQSVVLQGYKSLLIRDRETREMLTTQVSSRPMLSRENVEPRRKKAKVDPTSTPRLLGSKKELRLTLML